MAVVRKDQGLILGKMQRGEPITPDEQAQIMSRSIDFSKGSPNVADFTDGSSIADKTPDVGVMESGPDKAKGLGTSVANMGSGIAGAAGYGFPGMNTATATVGSVADGMPLGQTAVNAAWGVAKDVAGLMGPVGHLGMAAFGMFSSENPTAAFGSFAGGMVGSAVGGPWGGLAGSAIGGYAGNMARESYNDGLIGDALGARTFEGLRDYGEDQGWSKREMAEALSEMSREEARGQTQGRDISGSTMGGYSYGDPTDLGGRRESNTTDSLGNPASVGVTEGSPFGGASFSTPGSTERGLVSDQAATATDVGMSWGELGSMAAGMFGGGSDSDSGGGIGGGNAGGARGGGSEGNSGYW